MGDNQSKTASDQPKQRTVATENIATSKDIVFDRDRINLDSHQLVWLDANVYNAGDENSTTTIASLRQIIDYTKLFDTVESCQQYLENKQNTSQTFLVTSGQLGEILIPKIHHLDNIIIVYVYCQNKDYHQTWTSKYPKVKQVHTILHALLNDLKKDVDNYLKAEKLGVVNNSMKSENSTGYIFSWWKYLPRILLYLPYTTTHRMEFISCLRAYYDGKDVELKILDEFESTYTPEKAIWWYTRETFLYRLLNRALRQQNIQLLFLFGFFLRDIYRQLKTELERFKQAHKNNPILKCYRGQVMSEQETNDLVHCGGLVINNSLFSTSLDRKISMSFLKTAPISKGINRVLFDIEIDVQTYSHPFADISHLSDIPSESEVLFMMCIPLRLKSQEDVYDFNEQIWIFKLKIEHDFSLTIDDEYLEDTTPRRTLLNCLRMLYRGIRYNAPPDTVDIIFDELMHFFPHEKWILAIRNCCHCGYVDAHKLGTLVILEYYEEAIRILLEYANDDELNCYIDIVHIYISMDKLYRYQLKNIEMVQKVQDLAVSYSELGMKKADNDYERMLIEKMLSEMYKKNMDVSKDETVKRENFFLHVQHKELEIDYRLKCRPSSEDDFEKYTGTITCPTLAELYVQLGHCYRSMEKWREALATFDKVLVLYRPNFRGYHREKMIAYLSVMVRTCFEINDYHAALKYQSIAHEATVKYHNGDSNWDKRYIADSHVELSDIYVKLQQLNLAAENLQITLKIYKDNDLGNAKRVAELENKMEIIRSQM